MSDLVFADSPPSQNGTSKLAKSGKKKTAAISSAIPNETFLEIERVDAKIGAGFSAKLLAAIALQANELQAIVNESEQIEYILKMSTEHAEQTGREKGRQKAEREIRDSRIAKLHQEAGVFMSNFEDYFNGFLKLGLPFGTAVTMVKSAAEQHYIDLEVTKSGDSFEYEWNFTLNQEAQ
ncbi:MAG: hypothetical protein PUP93_26855 [Rhizonema sp. NSF051]|nr:hypothetical protein [Rhizonema sp. NSF051]